jgi:hypothetical protein
MVMDDFRRLRSRLSALAAVALLVGMTGGWLVNKSVEDSKAGSDARASHPLMRGGAPLPPPAALDRTSTAPTDLEVRTPRFAYGMASHTPASNARVWRDGCSWAGNSLTAAPVSLQILFCTLQV